MDSYDEKSIKVLEGTEGVRLRPAMYIGDVSKRGLHHLVYEVIDNSIDEAMAGRCDSVTVVIHEDNSISIQDDGAGIPAGMHPEYGVPTLEIILTKLHSGGKFEKKAYQVSGGLHGIGLAAVCALSEKFRIESYRDGKIYTQDYSKGKKLNEVHEDPIGDNPTGTLIHFKPDSTIFTVTEFDYDVLAGRFRELAYLTTKFRINFADKRNIDKDGNMKTESFYFEGGLKQFVDDLVSNQELLISDQPTFHKSEAKDNVIVEVAFSYSNSFHEDLRGFVNNINTHEGGTHITGFKTVLTRSINDFAKEFKKFKKEDDELSGNDVREGLTAIISVKVPEPQFEGQTKTKLGNSEVAGIVQQALGETLKNYLQENQKLGFAIIDKALMARRAREAAKKARELVRKDSVRSSLPGKLFKSKETDPLKRELFLVEGQSAGGTAVKGRDQQFQEILFLRGKVLNVEKARLDRALSNQELRNIITAVGTGIKDEFDLSKIRYGKIIFLTDADVDGAHIATLLFTFFYRYMKPIIEEGYLYIARPPLYKVTLPSAASKKTGQNYYYVTKEPELVPLIEFLDQMGISRESLTLNRFKGLGEMNHDQLEETTMSVKSRTIERVQIHDAVDAEEWLVKLMGDDVGARKEFIRDGVFEPDGLENRGEFYKLAFSEDEEDEDIVDPEEDIIAKKVVDLDEFDPDTDFLEALESSEFFTV